MKILKGHKKTVYSMAFTPDGRRLASCSLDCTIRVWDLERGLEELALSVLGWWHGCVTIDPSGRFLASGGGHLGIRVWDLSAGGNLVFQEPESVAQIQFSPAGTSLVATGSEMRRWKTHSWERLPGWGGSRESTGGRSFPTGALAFSRHGSLLATAHNDLNSDGTRYDPVIRLWDATTGEPRGEFGCRDLTTRALAFGRDDRALASLHGPTLRVWSIPEGREVVRHKVGTKHLTDVAFTPDGRFLAAVSNDETVRLWDAETWRERTALAFEIGELQTIAFSPDGMRAAVGGRRGKIVIWDVDL
jgi:WD40 repeat protein